MTLSHASWPVPAIVARLRAAGCVFAEDEARLLVAEARTSADLAAMVDRRAAGLPLEQVLGWAEFCGLRVAVEPGVFVPRRRTEFLVLIAVCLARQAVMPARPADMPGRPSATRVQPAAATGIQGSTFADHASAAGQASSPAGSGGATRPAVVLDLCCGSGAVGAAVASVLGGAELHAADIDPAAVRCARRNVAAAGGRVYEGDLYQPLPETLRGRVDLLVANAPYVPTGEVGLLPPEAREHEPNVALDGGGDGLAVVRQVIAGAPQWLAAGGSLVVETSERQAAPAEDAMAQAGLTARVTSSPEPPATVVIGTRRSRLSR